MENSTAPGVHIVALVDELAAHLQVGEESLQKPLKALVKDLGTAVESFLGFQLIMIVDGHPVRLSLFDYGASGETRERIATSLQIPLQIFTPATNRTINRSAGSPAADNPAADSHVDEDSTITFYAATPGAFVDLAADLDYVLRSPGPGLIPDHRGSLDQHLTPVSLVSGLFGLAELSVISTAVGVLIDRGHQPEDAPAELRRRAGADGVSSHSFAVSLLQRLASPLSEDHTGLGISA